LIRLKNATVFDLDVAKSKPLVLSIGYRYLPSPNKPTVNRIEPVVTFHLSLANRILLPDGNRFDLDWSNGGFSWRYRKRPTVEHRFTIRSYHPAPSVSA